VSGAESHLFGVLYGAVSTAGATPRWRADVLRRFDERAAVAATRVGGGGPQRWITRAALEQLLEGIGDDDVQSGEAARLVIGGILDAYFVANGGGPGKVLVEKTPAHLAHARQILDWWPDARCVELIRDGRDVCVSLEHKSRVSSWAPARREEQARTWAEAVRAGAALRTDPAIADRWHLIRYEDLGARGPTEVRRLLRFAGLPHDDAAVMRIVASTSFERTQRPGNTDHVRKGTVGEWRSHFDEADLDAFRRITGSLLADHGYGD
jgi:hypothetical protein